MNAVPGRERRHSELEATRDETTSDIVEDGGQQSLTLAADWRLQAARLAGGDALLEALVVAAAELDRPTTAVTVARFIPQAHPATKIFPKISELVIQVFDSFNLHRLEKVAPGLKFNTGYRGLPIPAMLGPQLLEPCFRAMLTCEACGRIPMMGFPVRTV